MAAKKGLKMERSPFGKSYKIERLKGLARTLLKEVESLDTAPTADLSASLNFYGEVERLEIEMIRYALHRTDGHQRRAARMLGLKVTTLHSKIKRYGLTRDVSPAPSPGLKRRRVKEQTPTTISSPTG